MTLTTTKWSQASIKDACELIIDCVNKTAPTVAEPTPYKMIRTTNVRDGWVNLSEVKYVTEEVYRRWTRREVPRKGDVILTREAPLGEVGMLRSDDAMFLGQRLVMYRADPEKLDNRFLLYAFQSDYLQSQIKALGSGATVEHMRVPDCEKLLLHFPPLSTQRKIAAALSAYDDLIENNTRRIEILEEMAQRIYREWFVQFRFPGHEKIRMVESPLGSIPESWDLRKLGDVIELAYGKALKKDSRMPGNIPVYGSGGIVGYHEENLAESPGIIVGRKGNVGSVYWSDYDFFPIDTVFYVQTEVNLHYVFYNLRDQNFINNDAAVPGLNRNQAYSLPFLLPDGEILGQFEKVLNPMFQQVKTLREKNSNLRRTRDLLLPKLISGEVDVEDVDLDAKELIV